MTSDQLKAFRKRYGLTQAELAEKLGFTRLGILLMESGERPILTVTELALQTVARKLQKKARK